MDRILTEFPQAEFVQLQINYLDWDNYRIQSRKCYEVARKHDKPVVIMEPVKGGTLAAVPDEAAKLFQNLVIVVAGHSIYKNGVYKRKS